MERAALKGDLQAAPSYAKVKVQGGGRAWGQPTCTLQGRGASTYVAELEVSSHKIQNCSYHRMHLSCLAPTALEAQNNIISMRESSMGQ